VKQILHIGKVSVLACRGSLNLNSRLDTVPGSFFLTLYPEQFGLSAREACYFDSEFGRLAPISAKSVQNKQPLVA